MVEELGDASYERTPLGRNPLRCCGKDCDKIFVELIAWVNLDFYIDMVLSNELVVGSLLPVHVRAYRFT